MMGQDTGEAECDLSVVSATTTTDQKVRTCRHVTDKIQSQRTCIGKVYSSETAK